MSLLRRLHIGLRRLFRRELVDRELDDEIRHFLEEAASERERAAVAPETAARATRVERSSLELAKDEALSRGWGAALDVFTQDLCYAMRRLRRSPGFAAAAILTLALAIGANTAVFSVVDRVLLRPLDVPEPGRLVVVWETSPQLPVPVMYASPPILHDWQARARSFDAIGGFQWRSFIIGRQRAEQVPGARVTAGLFEALGVQPQVGRLFLKEEDRANARPVAILSDALWKRRFGADPHILGRMVPVGGVATEIVGVMPPGFGFPPPLTLGGTPAVARAEIWVPHATDIEAGQRGAHYLAVVARLGSGVSLAAADREMNEIQRQIERENPEYRDWHASVVPLVDEVVQSTRASITLLAAAVGFMLLLACANVANLLLARGVGRRRELSVRAALGARRGRLAAQMLTESLVLALLGCAAGILLALMLVRLIVTHGPPTVPGLQDVTVDRRVLGFAVLASLLAALLTGVAPTLSAMKTHVNAWLTERGAAATAGGLRVQRVLAVGQVALAVAVLVTAGLLIESFRNLARIDPGFRPERVVTAKTYLGEARYSGDTERVAFMDRLLRESRALPGLSVVGMADGVPIGDNRQGGPIWRVDQPRPDEPPTVNIAWVTDGYFESLRMPILRGRAFTMDDGSDAPDVTVINRRLARMLFGDEDPIGRHVDVGNPGGEFEVIGVVSDDRHTGIDTEPTPTSFVSLRQRPRFSEMALFARTEGAAEAALTSIRGVVRELDPELPFFEARSMEQVVSMSLATPRSLAWMLSGFALSGLILAAIGVFGVLSHAVGQRTQEIGVRLAIGASPGRILRMVLGQGLMQVGAGLVLGFAGAAALSRLVAGLLFGVTAFSLVTYVAVAVILACIGVAACLLPARRAMRIDPATAVRVE